MANRKRNVQMKFYVTEDEKRLIDEKMSQLPTKRYGAYLRKMAIDGYIIQVDTTDIREMTKALGSIGRNINQIAKAINEAFHETERVRLDALAEVAKAINQNKSAIRVLVQARKQAWSSDL